MPVGTEKILGPSGAGMMGSDGKLTQAARNRFIKEVLSLQTAGNENGLGISKINPILQIPIPPFPGPSLPSIKGKEEKLFWFDPDPFASLSIPYIEEKGNKYDKYVIEGIYEKLVSMLNINGKTLLGPIFDPTIFLDLSSDKFSVLTLEQLPQILIELVILGNLAQIKPMPGTAAEIMLLKDYGIGSPKIVADLVPLILSPPVPTPPIITIPEIPILEIPNVGKADFALPKIVLGLFTAPAQVFPSLIGELTGGISIDPIKLVGKIMEIIFNIVYDILKSAGVLLAPLQLLSSTMCILIKNLAGMILCCMIGTLFGTGLLVKIVSNMIGLT